MKWLRKFLQVTVKQIDRADALAVIGFIALCYGCWLAWPPLGFIVGGLLLLIAAFYIGKNQPGQDAY